VTLCWQRLARNLTRVPAATLEVADLAGSLGLGTGTGRNAPISRTIKRMVMFRAARHVGETLAVRLALAPLERYRWARLSDSARACAEAAAGRRG